MQASNRYSPGEAAQLDRWNPMVSRTSPIEIAIVFHIQNVDTLPPALEAPISAEAFQRVHGVSGELIQRTADWLVGSGFKVIDRDHVTVWARGTFDSVARALHIDFEETYRHGQRKFRPTAEPTLPDWLAPWVLGVIGLDNVGELHPKHRRSTRSDQLANGGQGFFPADLVSAYNVPSGLDGSGVTIGVLEFSNGYRAADLNMFWSTFGIAAPSVTFVSVDGTPNDGGVSAVDLECTLDLEWAGAMAPGADLVVYEAAAGSSDRSFGLSVLRSLRYVLQDQQHQPSVLSISYGDGESRFAPVTMQAWDNAMLELAARGVTVFVASGDEGAYGLHGMGRPIRHVDAPANCPHAVAVGGTHLVLNAEGVIGEETGWTDTNNNGASGGGLSQIFGVPSYQRAIALPVSAETGAGRGVPDVALNADPDTGYAVVFQGATTVVGGTSVASPIWAAFSALLQESRRRAGKGQLLCLHHHLYQLGEAPSYHDITVGNNNYYGVVGYHCTPGWDAVTGLGSVDVSAWIAALS